MKHLATQADMKRHLLHEDGTVKFNLDGACMGMEVMDPVVIDPSNRTEPFTMEGIAGSGQDCNCFAVAVLDESRKQVELAVESQENSRDKMRHLIAQAHGIGHSGSKMVQFGNAAATQDSAGKHFLHGMCAEDGNQDDCKSMKFLVPVSEKEHSNALAPLALGVGRAGSTIVENHICSSQSMKDTNIRNKNNFEEWVHSHERCFELNSDWTGTDHAGAAVGGSLTTFVHKDNENASAGFEGGPDHHICLTDNPNIGFLVCVVMMTSGVAKLLPVLVVQRKHAFASFCGGSCHHGSVHIGTCLNQFEHAHERDNLFQHEKPIPECHTPLDEETVRVFCTSCTKSSLPVMQNQTLDGHQKPGQSPRTCHCLGALASVLFLKNACHPLICR